MIKMKVNPRKKISYEKFRENFNDSSNRVSTEDYLLMQLKNLEKNYNMTSNSFYSEYQKGKLPDKYDYLKWAHLWKCFLSLSPQNKGANKLER